MSVYQRIYKILFLSLSLDPLSLFWQYTEKEVTLHFKFSNLNSMVLLYAELKITYFSPVPQEHSFSCEGNGEKTRPTEASLSAIHFREPPCAPWFSSILHVQSTRVLSENEMREVINT